MRHHTAPAASPSRYRFTTFIAAACIPMCLAGCVGLGGRGQGPVPDPYLAPAIEQPAVVPYAMPAAPVFSKELANLKSSDIADFDKQPKPIRALIETAIGLTRKRLPYKFGADDPSEGGLDCSGFVHYSIQKAGMRNIPRMSADLFEWVKKSGEFRRVRNKSATTPELDRLRPGDLLFWTHTQGTRRGDAVSHVKIYLGRRKSDNCPLMAGATNGRDKNGGGAIYEFFLEGTYHGYVGPGDFFGYGPIPGLKEGRTNGGFLPRQ